MGTRQLAIFNPPATNNVKIRRPELSNVCGHDPDALTILPRYLRDPNDGIVLFRPGNELGEAQMVATIHTSEADAVRFSANEAMYNALEALRPQVEELDRRFAAWKSNDCRGNPLRWSFSLSFHELHDIQKALLLADGKVKCSQCHDERNAAR